MIFINSLELKSQRVKRGFTQKDVAKKLSLTTSTYTKKENGKNPFTLEEIKTIKCIFSLENEQLINIFLK